MRKLLTLFVLVSFFSSLNNFIKAQATGGNLCKPNFRSVAGGYGHSVKICYDGTVMVAGRNSFGELGNGSNANSNVFVPVNSLTDVKAVECGGAHSLALKNDNTVWAWGNNYSGGLGNGSYSNTNTPVQVHGGGNIGFLTGITAISGGGDHSLALKNDSTVWAWGSVSGTNVPVQITSLTGIISIACGGGHSLALRKDGTVWAWGNGLSGQLGNGSNSNSSVPVQVSSLTGIIAIAAGVQHSLVLKNDGTLWAWGYNFYGELGNGSNSNSNTPVQVHGVGNIGFLTDVKTMQCGQSHSLALKNDGTVYTWGGNYFAQLGNGSGTNSNVPVQVHGPGNVGFLTNIAELGNIDEQHSFAFENDGTLWTWGYNYYGQFGNGNNTNSNVPVLMGGCAIFIPRDSSQSPVICQGQSLTVGVNIYSVSGTYIDTLTTVDGCDSIVTTNLTVKPASALTQNLSICSGQSITVGSNTYSASGTYKDTLNAANGCDSIITTILTIKPNYNFAQNVSICSGQSITVGSNTYSADGTYKDTLSASNGCDSIITTTVTVKPNSNFTQSFSICPGQSITVGSNTYSAGGTYKDTLNAANGCDSIITTTLTVKPSSNFTQSFSNCIGQSVLVGTSTYTASGTYLDTLVSVNGCDSIVKTHLGCHSSLIACGEEHSLRPCSSGSLNAAGYNSNGQLGNGNNTNSNVPVQVSSLTGIIAVASGHFHSLALKSDGTIWAWGRNNFGQLGVGNYTDSNTPVQVSSLPSTIIGVACGGMFSFALQSDGSLWAWGNNVNGQLGDGTNIDKNIPFKITSLSDITAIAGGNRHSIAVKNDGTVWAWGNNANGQLGLGNTGNSNVPVQVASLPSAIVGVAGGGNHSLALQSDGSVWAWGMNNYGQLGNGNNNNSLLPFHLSQSSLSDIKVLAGGYSHSLGLKNDSTVWAWGYNSYGQLGTGDNLDRNIPVQINSLTGIKAVACGYAHSIALKNDGTVWVWGDNFDGKLGIGSTNNSNFPVLMYGCNVLIAVAEINNEDTGLSFFPNPTSGKITVVKSGNVERERSGGNVEIYNSLGERVYSFYLKNKTSNDVDLSGFPKGIYFIKFYNGQEIYFRKIVLR